MRFERNSSQETAVYEIMHMEKTVASASALGQAQIFNAQFWPCDKLDGASCQRVIPRKLTRREAAIEAVQAIGLRQIQEIDINIFKGLGQVREMLQLRLAALKKYAKASIPENVIEALLMVKIYEKIHKICTRRKEWALLRMIIVMFIDQPFDKSIRECYSDVGIICKER